MDTIQANLKKNMKPDSEVIQQNLGAVQSLFGKDVDADEHDEAMDDDAEGEPKKVFVQRTKMKMKPKQHMADTHGAAQARRKVSKTNKRGQTKFGQRVGGGKKISATKKKGKKLAKF